MKNLNLKKLLKNKRVTIPVIGIFAIAILAIIVFGNSHKPTVERRHIPFSEIEKYIENSDAVEIREDGTYTLTQEQFDKILLGQAKESYDKIEDKEKHIEDLKNALDKETTNDSIYKQALIDPAIGGELIAGNIKVQFPKGFYSEPLLVTFKALNTDKESDKELSKIYSLTAQTLWGEDISKFNKDLTISTTLTQNDKVVKTSNLSTYYFDTDSSKWEKISSSYSDGKVVALTDHFTEFVTEEEEPEENPTANCKNLVDDTDPFPCFLANGNWELQSTGYNQTSLYAKQSNLLSAGQARYVANKDLFLEDTTIKITASIPTLGIDDIELTENATYIVSHKDGLEEVFINQKEYEGKTASLGEYTFNGGAIVGLLKRNSNESDNTYVIADAVSFGGEGFGENLDLTPPEIEDVTAIEYSGQFRIKAKITDASGISSAYLYYNQTQYTLLQDLDNPDYYYAYVPTNPGNDYHIVAYDGVLNEQIWHPTKGYISRTSFSKDLGVPPWGFYLGKDKFSLTPNPAKAGVSFCNQFCGDPINTATGNFIEEINLFHLPGNPNLELSITYNSLSGKSSVFGENWSYSLNYKLTEFINSQSKEVFIEYPGGRVVRFSGEGLTPDAGNFEKLTKTDSGYTLENKDKSKVYFDEYGDTKRTEDANGNGLNFTYSEQSKHINLSRLSSVKADSNREIVFEYNDAGFVIAVKSADKTILLGYNETDDLISITDAKGNTTKFEYQNHALTKKISALGYPIYTNTYDNQYRVTKQVAGESFTQEYAYTIDQTTVTDLNGTKAVYKFNNDNLMTSLTNEAGSTMRYEYDSKKNVTKLIDPEGNTTRYEYDNNGNRIKEIDALGQVSTFTFENNFNKVIKQVLKQTDHITNIAYDSNGNLTKVTDANGNSADFKYNAHGQVTQSSDFNGNNSQFEYNSFGDLIKLTDPEGNSERFEYDTHGKVTKYTDKRGSEFIYEYDKNNNLLRIFGPLNYILKFEYDNNNRLIKEIDANGGETKYSYDNSENLVSAEDQLGNKTSFTYGEMNEKLQEIDALGRITKYSHTSDYLVKSLTLADSSKINLEYNKSKIQNATIDARGTVTKLELDPLYRVKSKTVQASSLLLTTKFTYSPSGAVVSETDPNGNTYFYKLDKLDRIIEKKDPENNITRFEYDKNGNIIKVTSPNGNANSFKYDKLNRVIESIDPTGNKKIYQYDQNSNLVLSIDENTTQTKYLYDGLNRQVEKIENFKEYAQGDNSTNISTKYKYDTHGNLVEVMSPKGISTKFEYDRAHKNTSIVDAKGNKTIVEYDKVGNVIKITDRNGNTTTKSYDNLNRLVSEVNAENETTKYSYDPSGNLVSTTSPTGALTKYSYDGANRLTTQINALGGTSRFAYDNNSNIVSVTNENGYLTSFTYDKVNRPTSQINPELHIQMYRYDANGNLVGKVDPKGNPTDYKFDKLDRIVQEIDALGFIEQYEYDNTGNLIKLIDKNNNSTQYKYDSLYRQSQIIDAAGFKTTFEYDANGNILNIIDGNNNTNKLEYDELDRIVNLTNGEGEKTSFGYDKEGNQISKTDSDGVIKKLGLDKVYRLTEVVENFNVNGQINNNTNVNTKYEYDDNGNLTAVINPNGAKTTFKYDLLNRQIEEVDAENNSWKYEYDAVGNRTKRIDAKGQVTQYEYYSDNELKKINYTDGSSVSYAYDSNNNNILMFDSLGTTSKFFDPVNRLTSIKDSLGRDLNYAYDAVGNRTSLAYDSGETVNYDYFKNNWLKGMTTPSGITTFERDGIGNLKKQINSNNTESAYTYDKADRVTEIINSANKTLTTNSSFKYTYDKAGQRTKVEAVYDWRKPGKVITNYSYDALRRLTESKDNNGSYANYEYDRVGNRTQLTNQATNQTYTYNNINQVLSILEETGKGDNSKKINLDKVAQPLYALLHEVEAQSGKHISQELGDQLISLLGDTLAQIEAGTIKESDLDEVLQSIEDSLQSIENSGVKNSLLTKLNKARDARSNKSGDLQTITFDYDANGNRIEKTHAGPPSKQVNEKYAYDFEDRLTGVSKYLNNGTTNPKDVVTMQYDGMGRRLVKNELNYVFDGLDPVSVTNTKNGQYENMFRDETMRIISSRTGNGQGFWYQYDALDNIVGITKDKGQSNHNYRYSDFGTIVPEQGNFTAPHNNFTYNNQELDPITGLYEYYSRTYDSSVGVWLQKDSYRGSILEPKSLHSYSFVHQDPVGNRDYYGYDVNWSLAIPFTETSIDFLTEGGFQIVDHAVKGSGGRILAYHYEASKGWHVNADTGIFRPLNHMSLVEALKTTGKATLDSAGSLLSSAGAALSTVGESFVTSLKSGPLYWIMLDPSIFMFSPEMYELEDSKKGESAEDCISKNQFIS